MPDNVTGASDKQQAAIRESELFLEPCILTEPLAGPDRSRRMMFNEVSHFPVMSSLLLFIHVCPGKSISTRYRKHFFSFVVSDSDQGGDLIRALSAPPVPVAGIWRRVAMHDYPVRLDYNVKKITNDSFSLL
jgi:hypothetical protein